VAALCKKGWTITIRISQVPVSRHIKASAGTKDLLVQLKSAMTPQPPATISSHQARNPTSRATRVGGETWEARATRDHTSNRFTSNDAN
jgi:hypothetical protein